MHNRSIPDSPIATNGIPDMAQASRQRTIREGERAGNAQTQPGEIVERTLSGRAVVESPTNR